MNFTSQICTTKEQSELLLALGLKRETADMGIVKSTNEIYAGCPTDYSFENGLHIPAWSLHRLIEMMPKRITNLKEDWDMCSHDITFMITEDLDVNYEEPFEDEPCYNKYFYRGNLYDKIVDSIAWLIKEGYFNKEYLEK